MTTLLNCQPVPTILAGGATWSLAFSSFVPGWTRGWSTTLTDDFVKDVLSDFARFARQYIHRSNITKILMVAWEQHAAILHPFGSEVWSSYDAEAPTTPARALDVAAGQIDNMGARSRRSLRVRDRPGSSIAIRLTPIHQAIFQFLRGQSLLRADFELEAIVAFDCVLQSLQKMDWSWAAGDPRHSRADLCLALGFKAPAAALAKHVYFLRNEFVAHAGGWRWWDAVEYLEGNLVPKTSNLALRALRRAADLEGSHRRIDPAPSNWSDWLVANFSLLWDAVWLRYPVA